MVEISTRMSLVRFHVDNIFNDGIHLNQVQVTSCSSATWNRMRWVRHMVELHAVRDLAEGHNSSGGTIGWVMASLHGSFHILLGMRLSRHTRQMELGISWHYEGYF